MIFLKPFFKSLILASFVTMIVGFTVYSRVGGTKVDVSKVVVEPKPTIIFDKDGNQIAKFMKERKDVTKYEDIPTEMIDALLATEDRDFYDHIGINPKGILRALVHDIRVGSFDQGGSTITQQLVKNVYLTKGKTLERKEKEAIYATAVEQSMSKKEILTSYINNSDFIYNSFGVKNAIETYYGQSLESFKKENKVDRIAKSALLMGLLQSPTDFNPFIYPDKALNRRNIVIHNMLVENYITKEEYDQAIEKPLMTLDKPKYVHDDEKMYYPEFVSYVLAEIREHYHLDSVEDAKYIGMNVYTSFDPKVYNVIRKTLERDDLYPADAKDGEQVQSAMAIVNQKNGEIFALSGGRQAPGFLEMNRAYQYQRQPGSTFKPLIAYGPALETGDFTPESRVPGNSGLTFSGYTVRNFGGKNYGNVSMTDALTNSINTSAVYLLQKVGISTARDFAAKQGIKLNEEDKYLPIALGALTDGLNPLQLADAYQGFSNGGYRIPAHAIRKIVSQDGKVEYEAPTKLTEDYRTMKPETANYMKFMMRNGVTSGTGTQANVPGNFIAGKTGTAELSGVNGRNRDLWFTGFSNTFVASVWMGFDNPTKDKSFDNTNTSWLSARIFGQMAKELLKIYPSPLDDYKAPEELKPKIEKLVLTGKYSEEDNKVLLSWDGLDDVNYKIYRNGSLLHETDWNTFENITVKENKTYTYKVLAFDKYSNQQVGESDSLTVSTEVKDDKKNTSNEKEEQPQQQDQQEQNTNQNNQPTNNEQKTNVKTEATVNSNQNNNQNSNQKSNQ